jgi:hypothetical protein
MHADSFYEIGSSHRVCQDYAAHRQTDTEIAACLADSCSSSKDTDVGARLNVLSALSQLTEIHKPKGWPNDIEYLFIPALIAYKSLCLSGYERDTTFLGISKNRAIIIGDGVLVEKPKDLDFLLITTSEFDNSHPFYVSYFGKEQARHIKPKLATYELDITTGEIFNRFSGPHSSNYTTLPLDKNKLEYAVVFSDGIFSFLDENNEQIPISKILLEFFKVKGYQGEFINRRMNVLRRICKKNNWHHYDDLSAAGIYFGE